MARKLQKGEDGPAALRFLTHLIGDLHQPVHLVGRGLGGNLVPVQWNGRRTNVHKVWDTWLVEQRMAEASPAPRLHDPAVESALQGRPYDAYIRWILTEGLGIGADPGAVPWWPTWLAWRECPDAPLSVAGVADPGGDVPLCPLAWATSVHGEACDYAFAAPVPPPTNSSLSWLWRAVTWQRGPELASSVYVQRVYDDRVVERALARAGVRLALVLNEALRRDAQLLT